MLPQVEPRCKPRLEGSKSRTVPSRSPDDRARRDCAHDTVQVRRRGSVHARRHRGSAGCRGAHPLVYAHAPATGSGSAPEARARDCPGEIGARAPGSVWPGRVAIVPECRIIHYGHRIESFAVTRWTHVAPAGGREAARGGVPTETPAAGAPVPIPDLPAAPARRRLSCKLLGAPAGPSRVGWIVVRRRRGVHPKQYAGTPASFSS